MQSVMWRLSNGFSVISCGCLVDNPSLAVETASLKLAEPTLQV